MEADRRRWNARHRQAPAPDRPAAVVRRFARFAPAGRALDLAAGRGRHARYLAGLGFRVVAVDISEVALADLTREPGVFAVCADLERHFAIPPGRFALIVVVRYLERRLLPRLAAGLAPGGMLIYESFLEEPDGRVDSRFNPDYLLQENELLRAFPGLRIIYYREAATGDPATPSRMASLVALQPGGA
jgi:SAM-dependent methyltransferase